MVTVPGCTTPSAKGLFLMSTLNLSSWEARTSVPRQTWTKGVYPSGRLHVLEGVLPWWLSQQGTGQSMCDSCLSTGTRATSLDGTWLALSVRSWHLVASVGLPWSSLA